MNVCSSLKEQIEMLRIFQEYLEKEKNELSDKKKWKRKTSKHDENTPHVKIVMDNK